jgi:hypothetical protein
VSMHHQHPHDPGDNAASGRPTVPVAAVTSRVEAELIIGMLRNYGIGAVLSADDAAGLDPALQTQGVDVLVAPSDEAAARQLIAGAGETTGSSG